MDNVDLVKELLLALKAELIRYRMLVTGLGFIIMLAVLGVGMTWRNTYVSQATLEVDDSNIIQPLLKGKAAFSEVNRVEEARKSLTSKPFLEIVARKLGYVDDETVDSDLGTILGAILGGMDIQAEGRRSNFFNIAYHSSDPQVAYETAKVIVEEFVAFQRRSQRLEGEYAYDFIKRQADQYKTRLEAAELALQDFKTKSLDTNEESVQKRIAELEAEIQELELAIQSTRSTIAETKSQLSKEGQFLEIQADVYSLNQQKHILQQRLTHLRMQFQESYPDIISLKEQITDLEQKIYLASGGKAEVISRSMARSDGSESNPELLFDELRKQLSIAEVELKSKVQRLASIRELLIAEKNKADILAANQSKAADLMRDYTVNKNLYEDFLSRKENAELSVAITRDGRGLTYGIVNEPGYPFSPTGLTFKHFLLVAPVLAIGCPIGLILMLVIVDPRIRTVTALKGIIEETDVPLLGVINHYHTTLGTRVVQKDMLILGILGGLAVIMYGVLAFWGLTQ